MTFLETLHRHLGALRERNLPALIETLPSNELTLITSDGGLVRSVSEFIAMHRAWFAETTWTLEFDLVSLVESSETGVALLRLDYRDVPPSRPPLREISYLTLVFALRDGRWLMVQDQNTPVKSASG